MKLFRYRRPSLKTLLGVTKVKRQLLRETGVSDALRPFRWWTYKKREIKRAIGYESPLGRLIRLGLPRPAGCLVLVATSGFLLMTLGPLALLLVSR